MQEDIAVSVVRDGVDHEIFQDRAFHRLDLQFQRLTELEHNSNLREYLRSASAEILAVDMDHPAQVRLARFPGMTFAHLKLPRMHINWTRSAGTEGMCVVYIVRKGSIELSGDEGIVRRGPGAAYILPGESTISLKVTEPETELVYLRVPAAMVSGITREELGQVPEGAVSSGLLTPTYAFIASLCSLCIADDDDSDPLATAAIEVTRSAVRLILGESNKGELSLFSRAIEIILNDYPVKDLSAETIAGRLGVSSRTLQLAFQKEGAGVAAEIRHVRAVAAANLRLEHPQLKRARVAELTGFGTVGSLDRALRQSGSQAIPAL